MDELKRVTQQFAQAANIAGPTSYIPEVTGYSRADSMKGALSQGLAGGGSLAGQRGQEADAADSAARSAAMQRLQDKLDPSKYRTVRKDDGGFDFLDPEGNKIDVSTYAKVTGQRLVDILKDSENPIDQEYINDWSNMNTLAQAMYNNDGETVTSFIEQNKNLKGMKPQDLMMELVRKYPHLYRAGKYSDTLANREKNAFSYNSNFPSSGTGAAPTGAGATGSGTYSPNTPWKNE